MRKILIFLILSILLLIVGCTHETTWNEFTWIEYSYDNQHYDKAAIYIPFKFSGLDEKYYVQLDTGASSVLNGNSFSDLDIEYKTIYREDENPVIVSLNGFLANNKFKNKKFAIKQNYGPSLEELNIAKYKKIGNLGLDFFKDNILIIDFPQKRFMLVNTERKIPDYIKENSKFIDIKIYNNKLFIDSKIGNKKLTLFYDTGASIFPIVTTKDIWSELTKSKNEEADILLNVPSWGKRAILRGARAKNDWKIDGLTIKNPFVFYESSGLENLNFKAIKADGLLGNSIFYNNHIITIDLINNKLGIMKVSDYESNS